MGATLRGRVQASHCGGFPCGTLALGHSGSVTVTHGLSCPVACGPGIEPVSPALAGGFLTTGPPGKSEVSVLTIDYT